MKHPKLTVEERKVLGKKIKALRKEGILPGNVYGKDIKSTAVQVARAAFDKVFKEAGETGIVDLELKDKKMPVLIHNIATDYKNNILHADFYKVDLKEKIKAMAPVETIGEPKAVTEKVGLLMQIMSEVEVEALPEELPEKIEVNVEHLAEVDEQIQVSGLKAPAGAQILNDPEQVVIKIGELISKEAQEQAAEEAAAAEAAAAEAAEGEPTEGDEASEEKKDTEEPKEEARPEEKPTEEAKSE